jgi:hypothetical protein
MVLVLGLGSCRFCGKLQCHVRQGAGLALTLQRQAGAGAGVRVATEPSKAVQAARFEKLLFDGKAGSFFIFLTGRNRGHPRKEVHLSFQLAARQ